MVTDPGFQGEILAKYVSYVERKIKVSPKPFSEGSTRNYLDYSGM